MFSGKEDKMHLNTYKSWENSPSQPMLKEIFLKVLQIEGK
jgi:hypothetical protein